MNTLWCFCLGSGLFYLLYYYFIICKKPKVSGKQGKLFNRLLKKCSTLQQSYQPPFWCFGSRPQTILVTLLRPKSTIPYVREVLKTPDGGQIALDWFHNDNAKISQNTPNKLTVIILPGLTGTNRSSYVTNLILHSSCLGYRYVVLNYRGVAGLKLATPQCSNAIFIDDLKLTVKHVQDLYPQSPLMGLGFSLGGILLVNYLVAMEEKSGLVAGMTVSAVWCLEDLPSCLGTFINRKLFSETLARIIKKLILKNKQMLEKTHNINNLMKCSTVPELDNLLIAPQCGLNSVEEYYQTASIRNKVKDICVPVLAFNAEDDPFNPGSTLPLKEAETSDSVIFVTTKHGGHLGFLEGFLRPKKITFCERLFIEYAQMMLEDDPKDE